MTQDAKAANQHAGSTGGFKDPVCRMETVPSSADGTASHDGRTYYFCSRSCLARFEADPSKFLGNRTELPPSSQPKSLYTCAMHPEVQQHGPGSCPKCGMALEPIAASMPAARTEYTCPMHPEIVRDQPGNCPICGMALEPKTVPGVEEENSELKDMRRRFWISAALSVPVLVSAMSDSLPGLNGIVSSGARRIFEGILATPVVLWGGLPFFVRAWQSLVNRSLNMFTLIGLGVGVAYAYSVVALRSRN
jgi:Cu+-exporting ATPase